MTADNAAATHLESVARILRELADDRIELFEHAYHPQAFGSFMLVLGTGHGQVRFTWDGKEAILSVSVARVQNKNAAPDWAHDADFSLPKGEGVYAEIASQSVNLLAV